MSLPYLGQTRSTSQPTHLLHAPDTFVRTKLPGMDKAVGIVHVSPAVGARFAQYTAEFEPDGNLGSTPNQRFVYVTEGELTVELAGEKHHLAKDGYVYIPQGLWHRISAVGAAKSEVIEKPYGASAGFPLPEAFIGSEPAIVSTPLMGDESLRVKALMPASESYDFAVNTMLYYPGAALAMVEVHIMEHGLMMLEGGGIYKLAESWYPVTEGDFIWMAAYCPQWFGALGKTPAKYLIYKDWNRGPFL